MDSEQEETEAIETMEVIEEVEPAIETKQPDVPSIEKEARADGWVPKEEFKGDVSRWRSAEVFVDRKGLMGEITKTKGEMRTLREENKAILQHYADIKENSYKQAVKDLKEQYKEALLEGDENKAEEIDKEIENQREEFKPQEAKPTQAYEDWHAKNDWYMTDRAMTVVADDVAREMPNATEIEVYSAIEKQIKEAFPHKFTNPKRQREAIVESNTAGSGTSGGLQVSDLTSTELKAMNGLVGAEILTQKEYLADIQAMRKAGQ